MAYYRLAPESTNSDFLMSSTSNLIFPEALRSKLRPRDNLVVASWDPIDQIGAVQSLGVVLSVENDCHSAEVSWRLAEITLRPNPGGRQYWDKGTPFAFATSVVDRYCLADIFSENFPDLNGFDFAPPPTLRPQDRGTNQSRSTTAGFVYVIRSPYGFKIGKTVNMKTRTTLFSVKLPFPISIEHYAWFDDYSFAERSFHVEYHRKRLDGEWFDLTPEDLREIKSRGKQVIVPGLTN